jgi:integrase
MRDPKTARKLSVETIRALKTGENIADHVVKGLHVRGRDSGPRWHVFYRDNRGDRRRPCIGQYPAMGLEPAREAAKKLLQAVARGEDPSADKQAARQAMRMSAVFDKYEAEEMTGMRPRTVILYKQLIKTVRPVLGPIRAADVMPADITRALAKFDGPYAANNARRVLRRVFNVARTHWRLALPENPVEATKPNPHRARRRKAEAAEWPALVDALEALRVEFPAHVAAIFCLAYTGARAKELSEATAAHVRGDASGVRLVLTEHKTMRTGDERIIELPQQALQEIRALGKQPGGRLFGPRYMSIYRVWCKARAAAGCPDLRLHDLRRTWASHGKSAGASLHAVGDLLGHRATQTTAGYAYLFTDARSTGAQAIADSIDKRRRKPGSDDEPEGVPA